MGDTITPTISLIKPEVGASRSTWGTKWNQNADNIDVSAKNLSDQIGVLQGQVLALQEQMGTALGSGLPIGAIVPWMMFSHQPAGYVDCNGQLLYIAGHEALFAILGVAYGGDGTTYFGVPDLRGCVVAGYDGGTGRIGGLITPDAPGEVGGGPFVTLSLNQMPAHQHGGSTSAAGDHNHHYQIVTTPAGGPFSLAIGGVQVTGTDGVTSTNGEHSHSFATDFFGGGQAHPNMQFTCLVQWLMRAN